MLANPVAVLLSKAEQDGAPILRLFGGPFVTLGAHRLDIPEGSKRLLAYVALHRGLVDRRHAAGVLWPVGNDLRAAGNLRSALWRLRRAGIPFITADKHSLELREDVLLDVKLITDWTARVIDGSASCDDLAVIPWSINDLELLPGWYEDWALLERERVNQRVLHGLEVQSRRLLQQHRCAEAVEVALVCVGADQLRESAQQTLIEAHLAQGNWSEARRRFEVYRDLLCRELGIEPGPRICALIRHDPAGHIPVQQERSGEQSRFVRVMDLAADVK